MILIGSLGPPGYEGDDFQPARSSKLMGAPGARRMVCGPSVAPLPELVLLRPIDGRFSHVGSGKFLPPALRAAQGEPGGRSPPHRTHADGRDNTPSGGGEHDARSAREGVETFVRHIWRRNHKTRTTAPRTYPFLIYSHGTKKPAGGAAHPRARHPGQHPRHAPTGSTCTSTPFRGWAGADRG